MEWYLQPWRKYATFTGRAGRQEFWTFYLVNVVIGVILSMIGHQGNEPGILGIIFYIAIILPSLAVTARRLHDIGRSGWWQLLTLIAMVGGIVVLIMCALRGQESSNQFGDPPPLQIAA